MRRDRWRRSGPEVKPDYVLREIPYSAPLCHAVARRCPRYHLYALSDERPHAPGGLPVPTYVYEPVVTPVTGTEPVF